MTTLNVAGTANASAIGVTTLNVSGAANAASLGVSGLINTATLNVSGTANAATLNVAGAANASSLGVSGLINTATLNVSGTANASALGVTTLNVAGAANAFSLDVSGQINTASLNVSGTANASSLGVTTLNVAGAANAASLGVSGLINTSTLNVAGTAAISSLNVAGLANALTFQGDGGLLINLSSSAVVQPFTNLVSTNSLTTTNVYVSNIYSTGPVGNTYVTGNVVVTGNVYSAMGQLGVGGGVYLHLTAPYAVPTGYVGGVYGAAYPLTIGSANGFSLSGSSTMISRSTNGNFIFSAVGPYMIELVLLGTDNIRGVALGSNVADVHGTDQGYLYRYTTLVTQNPTELIQIPVNVTDITKYYYLDLFTDSAGSLLQTDSGSGGTYITVSPLVGTGATTFAPISVPSSQWLTATNGIYYPSNVAIGGSNPSYNLDVQGNAFSYSFISGVTLQSSSYAATWQDTVVAMTASGTVTLPLGSTLPTGKVYHIKKAFGTAGNVTIQMSGSDTLDGQTSSTITIGWTSVTVLWTGVTNTWLII